MNDNKKFGIKDYREQLYKDIGIYLYNIFFNNIIYIKKKYVASRKK